MNEINTNDINCEVSHQDKVCRINQLFASLINSYVNYIIIIANVLIGKATNKNCLNYSHRNKYFNLNISTVVFNLLMQRKFYNTTKL